MKKLLMLFLLAFPILIFAIINLSASIIGWYIPLPVEKIEVSVDNITWSDTVDLKVHQLNDNTQEQTVYVRVLPYNARNHDVTTFSSDEDIAVINDGGITLNNEGVGIAIVNLLDYGYNEITIITDDGKYEAKIDVSVVNPSDDPNLVKSIILEYKDRLHSNYSFGYSNNFSIDFKYFPKEAAINQVLDQISFDFEGNIENAEVFGNGQGRIVIRLPQQKGRHKFEVSTSEARKTSYSFLTDSGLNIKDKDFSEIQNIVKNGERVYQLEEIDLPNTLVINNGTSYEGNNFKITHKNIISGTAVIVRGNNTSLNQIHLVGPLLDNDGQMIPSREVNNLLMEGSVDDRNLSLTNSVIENGRYNLLIQGKSYELDNVRYPTKFTIENVSFVGSLFSGISIDNKAEGAMLINSTEVNVKNLSFEWAGIGIILQNSRHARGQKWYSVLNVLPHDNNDLINSLDSSNNWRNLDEASGLLAEQNVLGLLDELKSYDDVTVKDGKYYYVSPVIMIRGGAVNHSQVNLDNKTSLDLKEEIRVPSTIESISEFIGGRYKFTVYLLDPKYFNVD